MSATYTFTGQCYSQSGDTKKYEKNLFTASDKAYATDTTLENNFNNSCFYFSGNDTSYIKEKCQDYAYYTYTVNINESTGDYEYNFIAYAFLTCLAPGAFYSSYAYCAVVNGVSQEGPSWLNSYSYGYTLGTSYDAYFLTKYGGSPKYAYLKFQIATYWSIPSRQPMQTYYTEKISFNYNISASTNAEYVGVYLFSIVLPGTFVGTEDAWQNLGLMSIGTFSKNSGGDADSGIASGYVSCRGTSLNTAKLTVYSGKISSTTVVSSKSVVVGESTIYLIGIKRTKDSNLSSGTYRYTCSNLATLTSSSWSTTKPSI